MAKRIRSRHVAAVTRPADCAQLIQVGSTLGRMLVGQIRQEAFLGACPISPLSGPEALTVAPGQPVPA